MMEHRLYVKVPGRPDMVIDLDDKTYSGEPQRFIELASGRSLEIVYESAGLPEKKCFYSVQVNCTKEEFEKGAYAATIGVIETYESNSLAGVEEILEDIFRTDPPKPEN